MADSEHKAPTCPQPGLRKAQGETEAAFLAMVRALRAARSGRIARAAPRARLDYAAAPGPAASASRPWAF
jgi:hypothetical protein